MPGRIKAAINRAIPWLLFGSVMIPALGSAAVGILVLAFRRQGGDVALGILAIALGIAVLTGTIISLAMLMRQNRMVRAQAELVAHVGHELRTPLASVMMGIETLKQDRFESGAERQAFLDMIERESNRLAILVEQAIGYQVAAGRGREPDGPPEHGPGENDTRSPAVETSPAGSTTADMVSGWLTRPDTANLIRVESTCQAGDLLAIDRNALHGALANLVNNAMTHGKPTPDRPVTVRVSAAEQHRAPRDGRPAKGRNGWIVIEVIDHGPGVRKSDRKRIFNKFQRGRDTSGNAIPGLGLGLSIVQKFAVSAGGRIDVGDTPGGGATFILTLPRFSAGTDPAPGDGVASGDGPGRHEDE